MKNKILKIFNCIKELIYKIISFLRGKTTQMIKKIKNNKFLNKIKNFFIKLFGYLFSVVGGLFKSKRKKEDKLNISKELKIIDRNILEIETQIKQEQTPLILKIYKKQLNENLNKIKNIKKKNNHINQNHDQMLLDIKSKINECENKINNIKMGEQKDESKSEIKNENLINKKEVIEEYKKINDEKENDIKNLKNKNLDNKLRNENKNKIKKFDKVKSVFKSIPIKMKKSTLIASTLVVGALKTLGKKPKKIIKNEKKNVKEKNSISPKFKNDVKKMNVEINKTYQKIETIKIKKQDDQELQLLILKDKVLDLKKEYYNLTKKPEFRTLKVDKSILAIDPNHLMYHDKSIDDLIDYIDISIKEVKVRMNKNKKEEKQIEKMLIDSKQIILINESINKDIELSKEEIIKIKKDINHVNPKLRNYTLINSLSNFFKNSINIGISLLPFSIFKNKFLATLATGILLNNRIRHMRTLTNNDGKEINLMNYELIINDIHDKKSCLEKTNYILEDTIHQLYNLKEELKNIFKKDFENKNKLKMLLDELNEMEEDLIDENEKIGNMLNEMNGLEKSEKLKIKKKKR